MLLALLDEALATEKIATEISHLPVWAQWLATAGPVVTFLIGWIVKAVYAFKRARREAMADQMKAFERDQEDATAPRGLPPPSPAAVPPSRTDDITERIVTLEVKAARTGWDLDKCREEYRSSQTALAKAEADAARTAGALIEERAAAERLRKQIADVIRERDELAARLALIERDDTDRPPPMPTTRSD